MTARIIHGDCGERQCFACDDWLNRRPAVIHMWGAYWVCRECALAKHGHAGRRRVAIYDCGGDFSPAALKRLSAAGIMNATALFLPAGRLSKADADARERAGVERLPDA